MGRNQNGKKRWNFRTYERYSQMFEQHIITQKIIDIPLNEVNRKTIKNVLLKVYENYSPSSVEKAHTVIHSVFEEAIDDELVQGQSSNKPG